MGYFYEAYFEIKKRGKAYKTEAEYMQDLYAFFDMCIAAAGMVLTEPDMEDTGTLKRRHVKELPGTLADAYDSVMRRAKEADAGVLSDIRKELGSGWRHLTERLAFTPHGGRDFKMRVLVRELGLSGEEQFMLLAGHAVCYDAKYGQIFADLQGTGSQKPTLGLVLFLYSLLGEISQETAGRLLQRQSVLMQYFASINTADTKPGTYSFVINRRTCSFLAGYQGMDRGLHWLADYSDAACPLQEIYVRREQMRQLERMMAYFLKNAGIRKQPDAAEERAADVLHIYGPPGNGKRLFIKAAAQKAGYGVIFADTERLEGLSMAELEKYAAALIQESVLLHALLCLMDNTDRGGVPDDAGGHSRKPLSQLFFVRYLACRLDFFIWMSKEKCQYLSGGPLHLLCMEQPVLTAGEREMLWREFGKAYPLSPQTDCLIWANQYILSARGIKEVLKTADFIRISQGADEICPQHVRMAVRQQQPNQLGRFAELVPAAYGWEDLVVSAQQKREMHFICSQLKYRSVVGEEWGFYEKTAYGRGVCALFYGAPGTGKTMAVQVIANELGLDLYRVDLSQLVSKYIGETEKNISQLFHKAKNINALLFFDEADALFSKRSEVKDSHDRNANAQTAHLLQKLEDYEGIAVLATNYINNIDDAFKRRIKFMIHFPFPQADVRLRLWKTILPCRVPCGEELDFEYYAQHFELSGSSIKEILTNAAYMAASEKEKLANRHIIEAVKLNFAKYGKILTNQDFGYLTGG